MTDNKNSSPFIPMFFNFVYRPESYVLDLVRTCRTIVISVSPMGVDFQWFESLYCTVRAQPSAIWLRVSGHVSVNCYSQQGNYPALRVVSLLVFFSRRLKNTIFVFVIQLLYFFWVPAGSGEEIHFLYFFFLLAARPFFIHLLYKFLNTTIKYRRCF